MADKPRYPRTRCCVPGCRRTSTLFEFEWVCGEHWRLVDRKLKAFRTRRLREVGRTVERLMSLTQMARDAMESGGTRDELRQRLVAEVNARNRWRRIERATWNRMKKQAIERAAGI